jgi:type I restriction enzyme S subunit
LAFGAVAKKYVSYVGNPKLMNNTVGRIAIALPCSRSEQDAAVGILEAFDRGATEEQTELHKLRMLKTGLTTDLLTGRVRVPETIDISAT